MGLGDDVVSVSQSSVTPPLGLKPSKFSRSPQGANHLHLAPVESINWLTTGFHGETSAPGGKR